jgi:hypothetical protein
MKRKAKIIVLPVLALLAICLFVPYLVQTEHLKATLIERISKPVDAETTVEKIKWRWLPLPHVTLYNSHILSNDFELIIPKTRLYPNWIALFSNNVTIGRIYLKKPEVSIHPSFFHKSENSSLSLPKASLVIDDGNLKADLPDFSGLKYQTLHFENTSLNLRSTDNHFVYNLQSNCSFADSLKIKGQFFPENKEFSASSSVKKIKLHNILTINEGLFSPLSSSIDMELDLLGQGDKELRVLFNGNLPDFILQRLDEKAQFNFKNAKFVFEKKGNNLKLDLIDLNLINPQLQIEGEVERYYNSNQEEPVYRLDLQSHNINLNEVRAKLLALLGDNKITREVCDIVRSGRARNASYSFNSPLSGFSHIESMDIDVDVASANIYVPAVDLNLEKASGPITIKDGKISGEGITTWLGNNFGSNGSFLIGLGKEKWALKIDVDIDADVSELPGILHHLIDSQTFKNEIVKFTSTGRTKGHLRIGDDIRDFSVKVDIPDVADTMVYYDRIPWPLHLQGGTFQVVNSQASWNGVNGKIGPHIITEISGKTSWEDDSTPTDILSLAAIIDSKIFLQELHKYPNLSEILNNQIISTDGFIGITSGKLHGPFFDPKNWAYNLDFAFDDFYFETPHLPGIIDISKGSVSVQPPNVSIKNLGGNFLNSPVSLSAELNHKQYTNWQGSLSIDAPVTTAQVNWLRAKNWLPEKTLPTTPSHLDAFQIIWDRKKISAIGTVRNKLLSGQKAKADFTLHTDHSDMLDFVVLVDNGVEKGQLSIQQQNSSEPIKIGWKGEISQDTLSALLAHQYTHNGHLSGHITFTLPADEKPFNIDGKVTISDLQRVWGEQLRQISIKNLVLTGAGNEIFVDDMDLEYQNETALIKGKLLFTPKNVHLDLQQEADSISEKKLSEFIDDLSYFFHKIKEVSELEKGSQPKSPSILAGAINLHAETFLLDTGVPKDEDSHTYSIQPLKAVVDLSNPYLTTLKVIDSLLCSLPVEGTLQWTDIYSQKDFTLATPEGEALLFEKFLPCLGVEKKFIEGSFDISATLTEINRDLTAGKFSLKSPKGTLRRLVFLSKIFQLINFTDLYNGLFSEGFPYTLLDLNGHIEKNLLIFDKAVIEGEGLDLIIQGSINLKNAESDLTVFIVPLKTVDTIIRNIPLIGKTVIRFVGGRKGHIITIPVSVTGNIKDPEVNLMPTKAVGKATIDFILDTITFPLDILPEFSAETEEPLAEEEKGKNSETVLPLERNKQE